MDSSNIRPCFADIRKVKVEIYRTFLSPGTAL